MTQSVNDDRNTVLPADVHSDVTQLLGDHPATIAGPMGHNTHRLGALAGLRRRQLLAAGKLHAAGEMARLKRRLASI